MPGGDSVGDSPTSGFDRALAEEYRRREVPALSPMAENAKAWADAQDRRQREQLARARAEAERLSQQLDVAIDEGKDAERAKIEAQMQALAEQQSRRFQNAQQRERAAARMQAQFANPIMRGALEAQGYDVNPLTEGVSPGELVLQRALTEGPSKADPLGLGRTARALPLGVEIPEFEAAQKRAGVTEERRERLQTGYLTDVGQPDKTAEAARMDLGKAMQAAVDTGAITEQQGLLMMAAGGLNADPMSQAETRTLLFDLLAQATKSRQLGLGRATTIARLIQDAPVGVNEAPGEVPVPEPEEAPDLVKLRQMAVELVAARMLGQPKGGSASLEAGLEAVVFAAPELVDRLQSLEKMLYAGLTVLPCHEGHDQHLQTPVLCDQQMGAMLLELLVALGVNMRELPRDVHRDSEGERWPCCQNDGRIGTWLAYGQFINPTLMGSRERRRRNREADGADRGEP